MGKMLRTALILMIGLAITQPLRDTRAGDYPTSSPTMAYAVVIKQSTYENTDWKTVADTLMARYGGELFVWDSSLNDVQSAVADYQPTHIGFVCEPLTASVCFVKYIVWPFTRELDSDPYGDAIWGIITGYDAQDALRLVTCPGFTVKTMLGGTGCCDLEFYPQGIATDEGTYNHIRFKYLDGSVIDTTDPGLCPTDRTDFLMNHLNSDTVDIFMTSGHGNHDRWQLHYPTVGLEGYFRSSQGQLYGDPHSGPDVNANSVNPKIYLALGNCYIGKISNMSSMAPAWIHTGGAYMMTGYVIPEGSDSHQHGGTKAFFARQGLYTWPEAFFLANQNLYFDLVNQTPGTNPPDLDGSALYGDPGLDVRLDVDAGVIPGSMYREEIDVSPGDTRDTVNVRINMNREDRPGYTGKWGNRHPTVLLPFRAKDVEILSHNCVDVVVTDNFVLMYVWYQGEDPLPRGATREVAFTCKSISGVEEEHNLALPLTVSLFQNYPNPFNSTTLIRYQSSADGGPRTAVILEIYNILGQKVATLVDEKQAPGYKTVSWDATDMASGIYFYRLRAGEFTSIKKMILLK